MRTSAPFVRRSQSSGLLLAVNAFWRCHLVRQHLSAAPETLASPDSTRRIVSGALISRNFCQVYVQAVLLHSDE